MHKAGFVNIVGNPNVGKSTLMNALVGERISIATSKRRLPVTELWEFIIRMICRLFFLILRSIET